jgi:Flp pilus assembly protein TadD
MDHLAGGLEPRGFHLTNLLIHLAVGAALMWASLLYVRFAGNSSETKGWHLATVSPALLFVGVFLLHPLNTQAVTYVVQRMASMAALFSILAFGSYLLARHRATSRPRLWYASAIAFWLLALGSKENAVLLLPVIILYELCFFADEWRQRIEAALGVKWSRRWTVSAWAGTAIIAVLAGWALIVSSNNVGLLTNFNGRDFSGLERLLTQPRVQIFYLTLLLWPSPERLNLEHDFAVSIGLLTPPTTLLALLTCLMILSSSIWLAARRPRYGFPILAYMTFHAIEAGPVNLELVFEHRMYLPSTMLVLLGAVLLVDARPRQQILVIAAIIILSFPLANWTHARNEVWADPLALQGDIARKSPNKVRAQQNFARALNDAGRGEEALIVINRAIELDPGRYQPHIVLGEILLNLSRPEEALQAYRTVIRLRPTDVLGSLGIGRALQAAGREEEAFRHFIDSGTMLGQSGSPWEAILVLQDSVKLRPEAAEARHALGSAYLMAEIYDQAIEQFRTALQIDPAKFESWYNLGLTADALGLSDEAIHSYQRFIERAPPLLHQQVARARERIEVLNVHRSR